jgi:S1-C subfamily serine protease
VHVVAHAAGECFVCDLYGRAQEYVVLLINRGSMGAGAVVSIDGMVVTNAHVVGSASQVDLRTYDEQSFVATLVVLDAVEDLALLRVEAPDQRWKPVTVEGGGLPQVGSEVYIIGHPLGLTWTVTRGIVSGIRDDAGRKMIQTDAPISPGNSGGPMLDAEGHLIGIVTSKLVQAGAENLAFARPASALLDFLEAHGELASPEDQAVEPR